MYKLYLFEQHEGSEERVAILDADEDPEEYLPHGFYIAKVLDIDGDATEFPTDRLLVAA
jgi:hypothetical protein